MGQLVPIVMHRNCLNRTGGEPDVGWAVRGPHFRRITLSYDSPNPGAKRSARHLAPGETRQETIAETGLTKFSGCGSGAGYCARSEMPMVRHECNTTGARPSPPGRLVRKSTRESGRTAIARDPQYPSVRRSFGSYTERIRLDPAAETGPYFRPAARERGVPRPTRTQPNMSVPDSEPYEDLSPNHTINVQEDSAGTANGDVYAGQWAHPLSFWQWRQSQDL